MEGFLILLNFARVPAVVFLICLAAYYTVRKRMYGRYCISELAIIQECRTECIDFGDYSEWRVHAQIGYLTASGCGKNDEITVYDCKKNFSPGDEVVVLHDRLGKYPSTFYGYVRMPKWSNLLQIGMFVSFLTVILMLGVGLYLSF